MIGASKAIASTVAVQTYGVIVTPSNVSTNSPSGCSSSALVTATVTGGVGPFTYAWTLSNGDTAITASDPTEATTRFDACGEGDFYGATFNITVTDTGNGNTQTVKPVVVTFAFDFGGTPP